MEKCLLCKSDLIDEKLIELEKNILVFTCENCGYMTMFDEAFYDHKILKQVQEEATDRKEELDDLLSDAYDVLDKLEKKKDE